jgi:NADH:ubiquinone oxidoreductase subunit 2 (subunit N)
MTVATILAFAAEESEHHGNVALETVGYGITAVVVFAALALVTLSYRNVANRHAHKAEAYARAHADDLQRSGHGH